MNNIKRIILFIVLLTFYGTASFAQSMLLSGKVYEQNGKKKLTVPGANIVVANSENRFLTGVAAGANGAYHLRIPTNKGKLYIIYSFVGLKSKKIPFTGQTTLDVVLEDETQTVNQVVVSARHIDQVTGISDREQTASTQRVKMDEIISNTPATSIEDAIQGQLGGVDIMNSGDPGAKSSIRIRGTSTLNGSTDPLIVIDGIPYTTTVSDDFSYATADAEDYGQLLNIAPTDIESIEVLKDAAATAIWGTQGGNGVLVITTKKGSRGHTKFNFSSKFSVKFEPEGIPMLNANQYVALMQDEIWNTANAQGIANSSTLLELLYETPEINYNTDWRYFDEYNQDVDWLSYVQRTALTSDNNFSMSGGGDKATYRFSAGYMNEGGTTIGTSVDRFSSTLNITYNFSSKLHLDVKSAYTQTEKEANWRKSSSSSSTRGVRAEALAKMPNKSPYWIDDDTGEMTSKYFSRQNSEEFQGAFTGYKNYHPIALAKEGYNTTDQREEKMTFQLRYNLLDHLTYTGWASLQLRSTKNKKYLPQSASGVDASSTYYNRSDDNYSDLTVIQTENKLLFRKNWNNKHYLIATALFRTYQYKSHSYSSEIYGAASADLADPITGGTVNSIGAGDSEKRTMSGILALNYTLLNKYIFSTTVNMEGNSALGKSERWGYFPSIGFAWQAQEEPFLQDVWWLKQAKIRTSYGQSGSAPSGSYSYIGTFEGLSEDYMDISAIAPTSLQLDNLKWESSREYDIGADFMFLRDSKLTATFDWYNKKTSDLLQKSASIPASSGFSSVAYFNSGEITNKGIEFRLTYTLLKTKKWQIDLNGNVAWNKNIINKLPSNIDEDSYTFGNGNYAQRLETGVAVGSFYGYKYLGVYQNTEDTYALDSDGNIMNDFNGDPIVMKNGTVTAYPGDAKYKDMNNDGVIDENDITYIGNGMPFLTGGGGFKIKYKNYSLTAFFYGRGGEKVINTARMDAESMYAKDNQSVATLRRWRNEGDDTDIPRALYNYGYNYLGSDRFVENASYLRLKTLSFTYTFPKSLCNQLKINNMNFYITGYNLFTWTNYSGQDPEITLPSDPTDLVEDDSSTPIAKRFACGLNINF